MISALPEYDLPTKREKTNLEKFSVEEKEIKRKPKKEKEEEPADWEKLKAKQVDDPKRKPSLVMGQGKKLGM